MQEVPKKRIRIEQLKDSQLSKQFDDVITIPPKYVFNDGDDVIITYKLNITSLDKFQTILDKLRYWMVKELPHDVYDYLVTNRKNKELNKMLKDNFKDFFLKEMLFVMKISGTTTGYLIEKCIDEDHFNLAKYFVDKKHKITCSAISKAIISENVEAFEYLFDNCKELDDCDIESLLGDTIEVDNYKMFDYLFDRCKIDLIDGNTLFDVVVKYSKNCVKFMQYLLDKGIKFEIEESSDWGNFENNLFLLACRRKDGLDIIKWLCINGHKKDLTKRVYDKIKKKQLYRTDEKLRDYVNTHYVR